MTSESSMILRLDCSPSGKASYSRQLADALVPLLLANMPGARVVARNLADQPPAPVTEGFTRTMRTHQTAEQAAGVPALTESDTNGTN